MIKNKGNITFPIWSHILEFGTSDFHKEENELIRLYNGMSLISFSGSVLVVLIAWLKGFNQIYFYLSLFTTLVYFFVIVFNYFGAYIGGRMMVSIGTPIWISLSHVLVNGFFCQSAAIISSMAITYTAFRKKILFFNFLSACTIQMIIKEPV